MTIVCLGDSLTYGYEIQRIKTWPALIAKESGERILNRGISGLLTAGMLGGFTRSVINENADVVLIMGGANDILSGLGPNEPEQNIMTMISRARDAGIVPLVGIPIPFLPPIREDWATIADFPARTPVYESYIEKLRILVETTGCGVVDFRAGVADFAHDEDLDPRTLYSDGIHLNEDGHRLFADIFLHSLKRETLLLSRGMRYDALY